MITVGSAEIDDIKVGSVQIAQVNVASTQVWPTGYYYTLALKQVSYSSGTRLLPTGANYAEFTCYFRKYRTGGTLVETQEVLAIPTASYCVNSITELRFDYDTYKATAVPADSAVTVHLSYQGATTTGTVSIAANSFNYYSTITPIVLSNSEADASGGTLTYTGGDYTTVKRWSSGYDEAYATGAAAFSLPAQNSSVSSLYAYAISATKTITVPSLANNQTGGQTYYDLVSDSYGDNGATVSVRIYQAQNSYHQTSDYSFWDPDNSQAYAMNISIPASPAGIIKFQIRQVTVTTWDSGYQSSTSTNIISHSSYTYQAVPYMNGGCISNIGYYDSTYTLQANNTANTGSSTRVSGIICTLQSPSMTLGLTVTQTP